MMMVCALLLLFCTLVLCERTWPVRDAPTLVQVLAQAEAGDTVELEPGEYVFTTPTSASQLAPLLIDKPLTLRSRDTRQRATLRNDGASLLIAITSSLVTIADIVVGAQRSGADERSIDILIGAGTQTKPASAEGYYGSVASRKRGTVSALAPSKNEIVVARALQTAPDAATTLQKRSAAVASEGAMRVLHDVKLTNVDFSASRSGANVGFARGSYATVTIEQCVFGRDSAPHINALVAVGDAQFASLAVHGNTLLGGAHVLIGSPAVEASSFGLNYWGETSPHVYIGGTQAVPETYCLNAACEQRGPVIDADNELVAYTSVAAALAAGVTHVRITDNIEVSTPTVFKLAHSTIEGAASCNGAPLVTMRAGGAFVSLNGALAGVRNIRMALRGPGAVGFVYTDGTAQRLSVARFAQSLLNVAVAVDSEATPVVLFDGVSVMGDHSIDQVAVLLNAPKVRVELEDTVVVQSQYGVVVHRGALVSLDSSFFASSAAAIYAETVTHQAALRVTGSTFIGCEAAAIELGSGASSNTLREFYISCSQFLFNKRRNPIVAHDCAKKPTLCAAALRYNTIITDFPPAAGSGADDDTSNTLAAAERRTLKQGANHVEHGRRRDDYVYFGDAAHQFALSDTQGRFSWVTGSLDAEHARKAAFLLASYAPMRSECFEVDGVAPEAAVISDVLEVRSDSLLHACTSLATRFRIDDSSTLPASLAVFGVTHLGAHSVWLRATSVTHAAGANQATIESTLAVHSIEAGTDRHTHRVVVVALEALPERVAAALQSGAATTTDTPRVISRRLCAVCRGTLPARLLDEFCGGSTDNVRSSFDVAYADLAYGSSTGAPRANAVSIYVYGTCITDMCSIVLDNNENIEGTSTAQRGTLQRAASVSAECRAKPLVRFNARAAAHSSLRYIVILGGSVQIDAPAAATGAGAPTIAYSTLDAGITVDSRTGGRYIGNDIGGTVAFVMNSGIATHANDPIIVEANRFSARGLLFDGNGTDVEVRIDRNVFDTAAADSGTIVATGGGAKLFVTSNENVRRLDAARHALSALGNTLVQRAVVTLQQQQSYVGTGATVTGVTFELHDTARLTAVRLDRTSAVHVDGSANVVIRDVHFDSIATSLQTQSRFEPCEAFELSTIGIDTTRSLIFAGDTRTLTAERHTAAESFYWARDGSHAQCADGATPVRSTSYCGCASTRPLAADPAPVKEVEPEALEEPEEPEEPEPTTTTTTTTTTTRPVRPAAKTAAPPRIVHAKPEASDKAAALEQQIVVQQIDASDSGSIALIVVLSVLGAVVLICLVVACCVALSRSNVNTTAMLAARASAGIHHHQSPAPVHHGTPDAALLGAFTLRKRPAKKE